MGALALTAPITRTGTLTPGAAVTAADFITRLTLGTRGVLLEVINGNAAPDVMSISDASLTPSGAAAAALAPTVVNGTSRIFKLTPAMADNVSGRVDITHTVIATVTYKLYPLD